MFYLCSIASARSTEADRQPLLTAEQVAARWQASKAQLYRRHANGADPQCGGLENRFGGDSSDEGSNPSRSASLRKIEPDASESDS